MNFKNTLNNKITEKDSIFKINKNRMLIYVPKLPLFGIVLAPPKNSFFTGLFYVELFQPNIRVCPFRPNTELTFLSV